MRAKCKFIITHIHIFIWVTFCARHYRAHYPLPHSCILECINGSCAMRGSLTPLSLSLLQLIPLVICVGTGAAIRHHHIRLLPFTIQLKRRPDDDERGRSWASAAAGCGKVRMLRMGWFTDRCKYQFRISAANLGGKHAEARSLPRIAQKVRVGESLYILSHRARAQHRRL
jgi:hypothetical protein